MIRFLALSLFLGFYALPDVKAQVAVELSKMNVLYIGLPNPLNIAAQGVPREDLRLFFSLRGTIIDSNGMFYLWPSQRGDGKLYIQHKDGDTLAIKDVRVRSIPKPELRFGTLESGTFSRGAISAQPGFYATLGEGFAYEGVKFIVDSCQVHVLTKEALILCKQKGSRAHPLIKKNISAEFLSLTADDVWVSRMHSNEAVSVSRLVIQSNERIPSLEYYPAVHNEPLTLSLNQCRIIPHDSVTYTKEDKRHCIQFKENLKTGFSDKIHRVDGDTFLIIQEGKYRRYSEEGNIIEAGEIGLMADSLSGRVVQGELKRIYMGGVELLVGKDSNAIEMQLSDGYYPIGSWHYYHENGQIKASGEYQLDRVAPDEMGCYFEVEARPLVLKVVRTGLWQFYDHMGILILEKEYP